MKRCVDCIHYKACEDWASTFDGNGTFPYESEGSLCESFEERRKCKMIPWFDEGYMCNRCGTLFITNLPIEKQNYCPRCGAEIVKEN